MLAAATGWLVVAVAALVAVPVFSGGERDQVATLAGLGLATSLGMTVAGLGLLLGVVRATGRDAVEGVLRTAVVLVLGGLGGAIAGRRVADLLLSAEGVWSAVLAGALGALVAGLVVAAAAWLFDRTALRTVTAQLGAS